MNGKVVFIRLEQSSRRSSYSSSAGFQGSQNLCGVFAALRLPTASLFPAALGLLVVGAVAGGAHGAYREPRAAGLAAGQLVVVLILLLVTVPTLAVTAVIADPADDAPGAGTLLAFLLVFFAVQLVTSGTEEVGWRGYLTHTLLPGRGYWDTGWAVGPVWAVWHFPVVIQIFLAQGMQPAAIVGSLAGFSIGISRKVTVAAKTVLARS